MIFWTGMHCGNVQTIPASLLLQMSIACMNLHDELEIASASAIQMFCSQIVRTEAFLLVFFFRMESRQLSAV
jgi:hypothetical protein